MIVPSTAEEDLRVERPRDRRALVDEARDKHYQDVPFSTSALIGGGLGAIIPVALSAHKGKDINWHETGGNAALAGLLGAVSGVGVEGVNRLLTRTVGPRFNPRAWHRDQDPHRWNSLVRTAPLGVSLLGSKLLLPYLLDKKQAAVPRSLLKLFARVDRHPAAVLGTMGAMGAGGAYLMSGPPGDDAGTQYIESDSTPEERQAYLLRMEDYYKERLQHYQEINGHAPAAPTASDVAKAPVTEANPSATIPVATGAIAGYGTGTLLNRTRWMRARPRLSKLLPWLTTAAGAGVGYGVHKYQSKQANRYLRAAGEGATVGGAVTAGMMLSQFLRNPANRRSDAIVPGLGLLSLGTLLGAGTGAGVEAILPAPEEESKTVTQ